MCESMNTESMATETNSQKLIEMQENNLLCLSVPIENESNIWYKTWNVYLIAIENSIISDVKRQALMELAKDAQEQCTKMTEKITLQSKKTLKTANKRSKPKDTILYSNVIWTNIIIKCCIIIVAVILSLDPFKQHSHLQTQFQHNQLLVYSSIYDCFHQLTSNRHQQYILFLSLTSFELQSFELERLSNVSLCIFYEDDHQSHPHLSKTKYHIRFIFPQACLLEYIRHAIILNYIKQAHQYRVEGLEDEADENYLEASDHCRMLASDLEEQSMTSATILTTSSIPKTSTSRIIKLLQADRHVALDRLYLRTDTNKTRLGFPGTIYKNTVTNTKTIPNKITLTDDHQPNLHLSKTKYHIRFIFPQACLLEYVRHAIILNYIKQAHQYRVEGLENEADENYLEASDQCRMLASDLEEQSSIINGREATDVIVNDSEDVSESYLQSFTSLNEQ
ncbi:unnamed protein product [Adineta steineri]|uniref:Uncharacterized protein n=1 Tax=Adineta steineri TaxID=433720 RepID=A0A819NSF2_9BILA|nr:unnamed protein product [Adineta steineri]